MKRALPYIALAALIAGPAMAQAPAKTSPSPSPPTAEPPASATPPGAVNPSPGSPSAPTGANKDTAANAGASTVMSGMSVKDNTGALIGEVKSVKNGEATIQMGSDSFSVDTAKLGVTNGVATINATQAEIKKMLPPKK